MSAENEPPPLYIVALLICTQTIGVVRAATNGGFDGLVAIILLMQNGDDLLRTGYDYDGRCRGVTNNLMALEPSYTFITDMIASPFPSKREYFTARGQSFSRKKVSPLAGYFAQGYA